MHKIKIKRFREDYYLKPNKFSPYSQNEMEYSEGPERLPPPKLQYSETPERLPPSQMEYSEPPQRLPPQMPLIGKKCLILYIVCFLK